MTDSKSSKGVPPAVVGGDVRVEIAVGRGRPNFTSEVEFAFGLITAVAAALGLDFLGLSRDDAGTLAAVWLSLPSEHTLASVLERVRAPRSPPVAPPAPVIGGTGIAGPLACGER